MENDNTTTTPKLIIIIDSGLGNQLFKFISAYGIAKKNNYDLYYHFIYNGHSKKNYFENVLKNFNAKKYEGLNVKNIKLPLIHFNDYECFTYKDIKINSDTVLHGGLQNDTYFKEYYDEILLKILDNKTYVQINNYYNDLSNSYFIHCRRGDYVGNSMYHINYNTYFNKAIEQINTTDENPKFYIVSDDLEYCKKIFKNLKNKVFVETFDEVYTLYLMASCKKGCICSHSSFSWWGSYLNNNPDKTVIFPSKWINKDWDYSGIYYSNVIKIDE